MKRGKQTRGQVWIETVIYTLIAFVMIGLVISFAKPKIQEIQDHSLIEQSINMLKKIDSTLLSMGSAGNQRTQGISIKKGEFGIQGQEDKLIFEMESNSKYSEPGEEIIDGSVIILTEEKTESYLVKLTLDYKNLYNITFEGEDKNKTLTSASTSYNIVILNQGEDLNHNPIIDISLT
jgi:hypothetical protein